MLEGTMENNDERILRLEALLDQQAREVVELKQLLKSTQESAPQRPQAEAVAVPDDQGRTTRRKMLVGGAVAAGAAVMGTVARPGTAAAIDGQPLLVNGGNTSVAGHTRLITNAGDALQNVNIFTVSDNQVTSSYESAIGAVAEGRRVTNGMYSYTSTRVNNDVATGHAVVARSTTGGRSHLLMPSAGGDPRTDSYAHMRGEFRHSSGVLWFCVSSGTPGTWKRLAASNSAGAAHAVTPTRAYDSRFVDGPLASGANRIVSVANGIDVDTGEIAVTNLVPDGASAVMFNLTATETTGAGFAYVGPGDANTITSSTINWATDGVTAANASMTTVTDRDVKVFVGGVGSTHFIIDITAYFM